MHTFASPYQVQEGEVDWAALKEKCSAGSLVALLDACGNKDVPGWCGEWKERAACLYEDLAGDYYNTEAPHLVLLDDEILETVMSVADEDPKWGFILETVQPVSLENWLKHWRSWLYVYPPKGRDTVLFRFYDPSLIKTILSLPNGFGAALTGPACAIHLTPDEERETWQTLELPSPADGFQNTPTTPVTLSKAQLDRLLDRFHEVRHLRFLKFLTEMYPLKMAQASRDEALQFIQVNERKANKLGFDMEVDVAKFLILATAFGHGFEANGAIPNAPAILSGPDYVAGEPKIDRLVAAARELDAARLQPGGVQ